MELLHMTDLMDDDIIAHLGRQEEQFVAEVKVSLLGAGTPAALLISDSDGAYRQSVMLIKMPDSLGHQGSGGFLVGEIQLPAPGAEERGEYADAGDFHGE